jgi:hypothetical protein
VNRSALIDTFTVFAATEGQKRHFWRVSAGNAGGEGSFSSPWSFVTGFPATPLLASPAHATTGVSTNPTFVWNPALAADSYRFQLSTDNIFSAIIKDSSGLTDTTISVTGLLGMRYHFWRVRATNGIGDGLWSTTYGFQTGPVVAVEAVEIIPPEYELAQNYPNPFNASTQIQFSLKTDGAVSLRVYDILGRETITLVDAWLPLGRHTVTFDASRLSSGTYIYVMTAGGVRISKKLVLLK